MSVKVLPRRSGTSVAVHLALASTLGYASEDYRRGICLSAVVSKVVNKLLLSRNLILTYVAIRLAFALEELPLTS